jgi:transcriptional regulator with XRE-family HTH domain
MARPVGTTIGEQLRDWRTRRHLSQLDLAGLAGVSARHLSFVETGRSRPSREMVLHLAEHLEVPLRARNALLLAAGFAPVYRSTDLDAPEMEPVRHALDTVLAGHSPYPAVVVDQAWELLAANPAVGMFLEGVADDLMAPPVNVLRVTLHPDGMAKRIVNLAEWSHHLLSRLKRQSLITGDTALMELHRELSGYPGVVADGPHEGEGPGAIAVPLLFRLPPDRDGGDAPLSFISTITTFGTAVDITLAELAIESFFPADAATTAALWRLSAEPLPA